MKQTRFQKLLGFVLICMIGFSLSFTKPASAGNYGEGGGGGGGGGGASSLIGPAIGLGITIIREVSRQKKLKKQQESVPVEAAPTQRKPKVTKKKTTKKKKKVAKPSSKKSKPKKTAKKSIRNLPRLVLPASLPVTARAKPRIYSIGDKPWASDSEFIIVLKPGISQQATAELLREYGLSLVSQERIKLLDQIVLKVNYPAEMSPQRALQMAADDRVYRAQPDYYYYPTTEGAAEETDMFAGLQYAFEKMGLSQLSGEESGDGVKLAVIDSGINADHPAIGNSVTSSFSAFPDAAAETLDPAHGTAIASIIAARSGMLGVAKNVSLMSAQVFRLSEAGHMHADSYDIVRGIDWAVQNNAEILNMSFAGSKDQLLWDAVKRAREEGLILVAAAGNEGAGAPAAYPAAYESVIAVTATDEEDGLYDFANRGAHVELAAPGVDVLVATGEDSYGLQTGTSMATAYIAGSIALMREKEPAMDANAITRRLAASVLDLGAEGRDPDFGFGRLDAYKALNSNTQSAQAN